MRNCKAKAHTWEELHPGLQDILKKYDKMTPESFNKMTNQKRLGLEIGAAITAKITTKPTDAERKIIVERYGKKYGVSGKTLAELTSDELAVYIRKNISEKETDKTIVSVPGAGLISGKMTHLDLPESCEYERDKKMLAKVAGKVRQGEALSNATAEIVKTSERRTHDERRMKKHDGVSGAKRVAKKYYSTN